MGGDRQDRYAKRKTERTDRQLYKKKDRQAIQQSGRKTDNRQAVRQMGRKAGAGTGRVCRLEETKNGQTDR